MKKTISKSARYVSEVYVISDPLAINLLVNDDIDSFNKYLDSYDTLDFPEPEVFDSEGQAIAFCEGLSYGPNERDIPDCYPLR